MDFVASIFNANPYQLSMIVCGGVTAFTWLGSLVTGNCSQVDRLWSILPPAYAWVVYFRAGDYTNSRLLIMAILSTLWGARLSFNFWRKGGYKSGEEDYRWPIIRKKLSNPFLFQLFNLFFISIYQNILIYLFSSPVIVAWQNNQPLNALDYFAITTFLILVIGETISDQQQWNFHKQKHALIKKNERATGRYLVGFYIDGFWKYSRHPNFFCEILIWWTYYLFTISSSGNIINWTIVGTVLLTALFQGSTLFTEYISSSKYPLYSKYQECTSRIIPWWPKNRHILENMIAEQGTLKPKST
jgi:steroid 5-alpha reductase family enzyme